LAGNAGELVELFKRLRAEGVTELRPYIDQHPHLCSSSRTREDRGSQ